MIKHILRLIWNQRKSNGWLLGELLLVSVCLWYMVDYFLATVTMLNTPVGFDIDRTYHFQFSAREEGAEGYVSPGVRPVSAGEDVWEAVQRLRRYPEVEEVAISQYAVPYTHLDNFVSLSCDTAAQAVKCRIYLVTPGYFDVYRISLAEGNISDLKNNFSENALVVTRDAAGELFNGKSAFRQSVYIGDGRRMRVEAIAGEARANEFQRTAPRVYLPLTEAYIKTYQAKNLPWLEVSVRVKKGTGAGFADDFMQRSSGQLETGNLYLHSVTSVSDIRDDDLREHQSEMNIRFSILLFLLVNIFLGIVGTFWFRTRHRQGEMGLRMALGSTRNQLRQVVITEGMLLLTVAFIPALFICLNIMYAGLTNTDMMDNSLLRFAGGIGITYIFMTLMILTGIGYPANEAARIDPAESLHYE